METKYKLGQEVRVEFVGAIEEISLDGKKNVRYKVNGGLWHPCAIGLTESDINKLIEPGDLKTEMQLLADEIEKGLGDKDEVPY
jgi:hypothetical protein